MRIRNYLLSLAGLALILSCSCCSGNDEEPYNPDKPDPVNPPAPKVVLHERAAEMLEVINREFRYQTSGIYLFHENVGGNGASYLWPYVGMMSGLNAMTRLGYDVKLESHIDNFSVYWRSGGTGCNLPGFGSSTNGKTAGGTRFYDDNAIAGIELVDAYRQLHKTDYLERCDRIYEFLKDAVDDILYTALWWNEDQKNQPSVEDSNKPSCANGYAAKFLLKYYSVCSDARKSEVLDLAKTLYNFLRTVLMDPTDKCYWNDLGADGVINKTKWTYNTGVMIENAVMLYEITSDKNYLSQAQESATGSFGYFVKNRAGVTFAYPDHDPWFNTKLVLGYIALSPYFEKAGEYVDAYKVYVEKGWKDGRDSKGLFFEDWCGQKQGRITELLQQAAVLEAYSVMALYYGEKK